MLMTSVASVRESQLYKIFRYIDELNKLDSFSSLDRQNFITIRLIYLNKRDLGNTDNRPFLLRLLLLLIIIIMVIYYYDYYYHCYYYYYYYTITTTTTTYYYYYYYSTTTLLPLLLLLTLLQQAS